LPRKTWAAGETLAASDLNTNFDMAIGSMPFYVTHTGTDDATIGNMTLSSNTTAHVGAIFLPAAITVNKIQFRISGTYTASGTVKVGVYSSDGATKLIDVTSGTISAANTTIVIAVSSVVLTAGVYYLVIVPTGTSNFEARCINYQGVYITEGFINAASEPGMGGTMTVTAGTLPTSFNPVSDITASNSHFLLARFDN